MFGYAFASISRRTVLRISAAEKVSRLSGKRIAALGSVLAVTALAAPAAAAMLSPIATSGHDQDIVVAAGLNVGDAATVGELGSRQFYEDGIATQTASHKPGLPRTVSGFVSGITGNTIDFRFQPFEQNNIVKFDTSTNAATTKSLTLASPNRYTNLVMAFSGGSLGGGSAPEPGFTARLEYTIHYAGAETQTGQINVVDWGAVPLPPGTERLISVGRINMSSSGAPTNWNNQVPESDSTANRWNVYLSEITTTRPDLNIESVAFRAFLSNDVEEKNLGVTATSTTAAHDVVVFGLSGRIIPEPSASMLAFLGIGIASGVARGRRRRIHLRMKCCTEDGCGE